MSEPYEIVTDPESPTGKSLLVRGCRYFLSDRDERVTDAEWAAKLQAKANRFAGVVA